MCCGNGLRHASIRVVNAAIQPSHSIFFQTTSDQIEKKKDELISGYSNKKSIISCSISKDISYFVNFIVSL